MIGATIARQQRWWRAAVGSLAAAVFFISYAVAPDQLPLGSCLIKQATGVSCLSCGMTRSFHAAAHADMVEAFGLHLFGPVLFAGIVVLGGIALAEALAGTTMVPRPSSRLAGRSAIGLGAVWVIYGIIRAACELMR